MTRGTLQVIGNRPVELVTQRRLNHVGNYRGYSAKLGMPESISGTLLGEEAAVAISCALGNHHRAVPVLIDFCLDCLDKLVVIEIHFGKQQ